MRFDEFEKPGTGATLMAVAAVIILALIVLFSIREARGAAPGSNGEGTESFCARHGCAAPEACEPCTPTVCPDVECGPCTCTEGASCPDVTVVIEPTACPKPPRYQVCKLQRNGLLKCPNHKPPRRILVPLAE